MRENLEVTAPQENGLPCVSVQREDIWALVEHLSYHRARVTYSYDQDHFSVRFLSMSQEAAQRLVDDWVALKASLPKTPRRGSEEYSPSVAAAESQWMD